MKKNYSKPASEAVEIRMAQILCGSKDAPKRWGGEFGQVPGLDSPDADMLALLKEREGPYLWTGSVVMLNPRRMAYSSHPSRVLLTLIYKLLQHK